MSTLDLVREAISALGVIVPETTTIDTKLEDLNIDSLDILEAVMRLEERTRVAITDEALEGFRTVGDVVSYLDLHKK